MTKDELVLLLKNYKENVAKLKLKENKKREYEIKLENIKVTNIDIKITQSYDINSDRRSENKINDKVGNTVAQTLTKNAEIEAEIKNKLIDIESEICKLREGINEAEVRLSGLYYKEKEITKAYYIENRTSEEIAENLYPTLSHNLPCSSRYIRQIVKRSINKMLKM